MKKLFFTTLLCCGMQAIMSPLSAMPAIEANASEAEAPDKSNTVIARIDPSRPPLYGPTRDERVGWKMLALQSRN